MTLKKSWANLVALVVLLGAIALLLRPQPGPVSLGGAALGDSERELRRLGPPWQIFAPTFASDSNGKFCGRFNRNGRLVVIENCRPLRQDGQVILDVGWDPARATASLQQAGWTELSPGRWTHRGVTVRFDSENLSLSAR